MATERSGFGNGATDHGPPERRRHHAVVVETRLDPATGRAIAASRVLGVEPLDLYRARGRLTREQFQAGDRLRSLFHRARLTQPVTSSWQPRVRAAPAEITESAAAARQAYHRAKDALCVLAPFAEAVCCYGETLGDYERSHRWRQDSGMLVLRLALSSLAVHFGLIGADAARAGLTAPPPR